MAPDHVVLQEEENVDLAARNAALQERIAELEALAAAAEAAAQAYQQQQKQQQEHQEPRTPQHQIKGSLLQDSMQERATSVLKRAADARRLSGLCEVSDEFVSDTGPPFMLCCVMLWVKDWLPSSTKLMHDLACRMLECFNSFCPWSYCWQGAKQGLGKRGQPHNAPA